VKLLIIVSLIVIFVVGGIGMFLTIPNTVSSQNSMDSECIDQSFYENLKTSYRSTMNNFDFHTASLCLATNFVNNNLDEKYTVIGETQPGILTVEESLPPGFLLSVDLTLKDNTKPSFENIEKYRLWISVHKISEVESWKFKPAEIWKEGQGWQETQSPLKDNIESKQSPINSENEKSGYQGNLMTEAQKFAFNEGMKEKYRQNALKVDSFNLTIAEMTKSYNGKNCNLSEEPKVCFVTSFEDCTNAIYSEIHHTIEGDPVLSIRKINSTNQTSCSIDFFCR